MDKYVFCVISKFLKMYSLAKETPLGGDPCLGRPDMLERDQNISKQIGI